MEDWISDTRKKLVIGSTSEPSLGMIEWMLY